MGMNQQDAQILVTSIYNIAPEDGLESPKHVEHPKIKTSYKNLCILLVHFHNVLIVVYLHITSRI